MYRSLILLIFLSIFALDNTFASEICNVNEFKQMLFSMQPKMVGSSIVSVTSDSDNFHYSSSNVDKNSQFYIGSVSKHMTAYILLRTLQNKYPKIQVEKLLNEPLNLLFPNSKLLRQINREWISQLNLADLLTHRSGLTDYLDSFGNGLKSPEALNNPIDSVLLLQSISFDPQKKYLYSNSNYLLLGKLIEEINQDTFDHIFEKMITIPLKMSSTFAPISGNYFSFKQNFIFSKLVPNLNNKVFIDMANAVGPGNGISTTEDLMKWGEYLFKTAPRSIVNLMLKNYGTDPDGDIINFGLSTTNTCLGRLIGHQGGIDSYRSFFGYAPDNGALIIIFSNSNDDFNHFMEMMIEWLSKSE